MTRTASITFLATTCLAAITAPQLGSAQSAINLQPPRGATELAVVETRTYAGRCGPAAVMVTGVTEVNNESFTLENGHVSVDRGPGKQLTLTTRGSYLSDYNGLACVQTQAGARLLVWSKCAGSMCTDKWSFFVVDPDRPAVIAPTGRPPKGSCDAKCASQILGSNLPLELDNPR